MSAIRIRTAASEASLTSPREAAEHVVEVIAGGGLAVVPLDVSYAFLAGTRGALERIFELKLRPISRPCPILATWGHLQDIADATPTQMERISRVANAGLPVGIVTAPKWESKVARAIPKDCEELLIRDKKLALFINMGGMSSELLAVANERGSMLFGSSANISGKGNSFSISDVPEAMLDAVDVVCESGTCRYANPERAASSIVDLETGSLIRDGILSRDIAALLGRDGDGA